MSNISFTMDHDVAFYGPFPVDSLNRLKGLTVEVVRVSEFKEIVTLTFPQDEELYSAIFIVGMYARTLMTKNNHITNN